ncbi:hypothetical protein [Leucobacter tenebrionis]|uniref:hypothetical protein n=1 Tax=Leucobacter tenebrionis TaxID=2873270 RepID=UPI001CA680F2|nr:hypothetical protein [Leucobacter tenebrionis]QZY51515.1 hypothetical protein KVY00_13250 [Leucobacter tenebrionis]
MIEAAGAAAAPPVRLGRGSRLGAFASSSEGIYGLILVGGMIVVSRDLTGSSGEALLIVAVTLIVFFIAHVYAGALARLAAPGTTHLGSAIRHSVRESLGLLLIGVLPILALGLGVIGLLRHADAVWLALILDGALLGALGWVITAARTNSWWGRAGGAVLTAAIGAVLMLLKVLIHH